MSSLELARAAYHLLVNKRPEGLSRIALAQALKTDDRIARDAVNGCRVLAATNPKKDGSVYIIGFDPEEKVYVAARDPYQARRIIAYQESRVKDIVQALTLRRRRLSTRSGSDTRTASKGAFSNEPRLRLARPQPRGHRRGYQLRSGSSARPRPP